MKVPTCARSLHSNRSCLETSWNSILTCKCKYSVYLPYRPRKEASPLCKTSSFTASTCISALASQRALTKHYRKDAVSSRWKIRHAQTVFPNNYITKPTIWQRNLARSLLDCWAGVSLTAKDTIKAGLHVQLIFAPLNSSLHKKQGAVGDKKQSTFMNGHLHC